MQVNEYVTSDTHFGHKNIIQYAHRPFKSVDEMDAELIDRWNAKVPKGSIVYHLGDVCFCSEGRFIEIIHSLNGTIRLVKGNHDRRFSPRIYNLFEWVKDYYESRTLMGHKIVMSHYAMLVWNKSHLGSWMLHGHSHGTLRANDKAKRMDVGIDANPNYEPWSYDEVQEYMKNRATPANDHHGDRVEAKCNSETSTSST